jgi:hypothetical protein
MNAIKMSLTNFDSSFFDNNYSTYRSLTERTYKSYNKIKKNPYFFITKDNQDTNYTNSPSSKMSIFKEKEKNEKLPKISKEIRKRNYDDKYTQIITDYLNIHYYNNEKIYETDKIKDEENYFADNFLKEIKRRKKKYEGIHQDIHKIKKSSKLISVIFNYVTPAFEKVKFKKLIDEYKIKVERNMNKKKIKIKKINSPKKISVPSLYKIRHKSNLY